MRAVHLSEHPVSGQELFDCRTAYLVWLPSRKRRVTAERPDRVCGGAGGIRTLDRPLQAYNGLANRRLQPLGHSSTSADMPDAGPSRKRQIQITPRSFRGVTTRLAFSDGRADSVARSRLVGPALARSACGGSAPGSPARCDVVRNRFGSASRLLFAGRGVLGSQGAPDGPRAVSKTGNPGFALFCPISPWLRADGQGRGGSAARSEIILGRGPASCRPPSAASDQPRSLSL